MDDLCNRLMKNPFRRGMYGADPLLAAGGPLLCSHKVTKGLSAEMLLCARGLCPANQAEPRAAIICPASHPLASASAKLAMPLQPHRPPSFYPLSSEAVLLTGKGNSINH
ncbi:hypothetical protein FHW89_001532 [Mucilaginibacter sp. SG564]|nr:hypothetical protein [Mucilaginibacter sp. SG564]